MTHKGLHAIKLDQTTIFNSRDIFTNYLPKPSIYKTKFLALNTDKDHYHYFQARLEWLSLLGSYLWVCWKILIR